MTDGLRGCGKVEPYLVQSRRDTLEHGSAGRSQSNDVVVDYEPLDDEVQYLEREVEKG
jgi:hypothetical protein